MPNNFNPSFSNTPQAHSGALVGSEAYEEQAAQNAPQQPAIQRAPQQAHVIEYGSGSSAPSVQGHAVGTTITQSPAATGTDNLPSWIQRELLSGKTSSWTNPKTGQTWYAPHVLRVNSGIWVSGPGYSGPVQVSHGNAYINQGGEIPVTTRPTTTIKNDGSILYRGSSANTPHIEYSTNGKFIGLLNVPETSLPAAKFTDYSTFDTADGKVSLPDSLQDGPITETGSWSPNADGSFSFTPVLFTFADGSTSTTLNNPSVQQLESYGCGFACFNIRGRVI